VAGVVVGGGLYLAMDVLLPLLSRGEAQDQTLSGRLIVWELTLQEFWKRPWTGFGFASYQDYFFRFWGDWAPGHGHNSWVHVAFENGIPGVVLLTGLTLALLRRGYVFWRDTGLLSYTLALALFCTLADIMSVVLGGKMTTLYGLVLVLFVQEEHLRARVMAQRRAAPEPARVLPALPGLATAAA
jgi:O-antigen ligase